MDYRRVSITLQDGKIVQATFTAVIKALLKFFVMMIPFLSISAGVQSEQL